MKRRIGILLLVLFSISCGVRNVKTEPVPQVRDFPSVTIPGMITDPAGRVVWLSEHFWDKFTDTSALYHCDSVTINGVTQENVEKQMGIFATLLKDIPLQKGEKAMTTLYERLEAFQMAKPEGNVFQEVSSLASRYFYDPNSPVRSEDLYLPFVSRMENSPLTDEADKGVYAWDRAVCSQNRTGTIAADFPYIDGEGRRRTLYGVKADWTLLIFGNPDCNACREIKQMLEETPEVSALLESGALARVEVNPDDYDFFSGEDRLYAIRAVPSLYLLDRDKRIIKKDALPEDVLGILRQIPR